MTYFLLILASLLWADDCILISGQSNAITYYQYYSYSNSLIRSFGNAMPESLSCISDSVEGPACGSPAYGHLAIGAWGLRLARDIVLTNNQQLTVINGGVSGSKIEAHLPSRSLHTASGRLYWRTMQAGQLSHVKYIYWWQGESEDSVTSRLYFDRFTQIYQAWKADYPNVQRVFVIRPRLCASVSLDTNILAVINSFPSHFSDLTVVPIEHIYGWDGCHWNWKGYQIVADTLFTKLNMPMVASVEPIRAVRFVSPSYSVDILGRKVSNQTASGIIINRRVIARVK